MNRVLIILLVILSISGCGKNRKGPGRIAVASVGDAVLYLDQIPRIFQPGIPAADSNAIIQDYINKWAKKELILQKAEDNLSPELKEEIDSQLEETRANLVIYQYQRQMMLERMDTVVDDSEMVNYFERNPKSFILSSNIVKALFIRIPFETPNTDRIRQLARSNQQTDLQQLETICYQFADKFDDFNEEWIPLDRISVELPQEIENEEYFLKRTTFLESTDSISLYFVTIRDYRLRGTAAPYEYVKDDIKRIILNSRRFEFIQNLENGIYEDALRENRFRLLNN